MLISTAFCSAVTSREGARNLVVFQGMFFLDSQKEEFSFPLESEVTPMVAALQLQK